MVYHSRMGIIPQTLRGGPPVDFTPRALLGIPRRTRAVDEGVPTGYHPSPCRLPWTPRARQLSAHQCIQVKNDPQYDACRRQELSRALRIMLTCKLVVMLLL